MSFRPVMNQTSKQNIVSMVNNDNTTDYVASDFVFSTPAVVGGDNPYGNTSLTLTGDVGAGKTGTVSLLYTRLNIGEYMGDALTMASSGLTGPTLIGALSEINAGLGIALQAYEVVDQTLDFSTVDSITVTVSPVSEVWAPGTTFTFAVTGNSGFTGTLFMTSGGTYFDTGGGNPFRISP